MDKRSRIRACLLGVAVGDAMGYTVDDKLWERIREDYGPDGLRGYDLVNGYAAISSYTQLAAWGCNALLLGLTRGRLRGVMAPYVRYLELAGKDWARHQRRNPEPGPYWVGREEALQTRRCMEQLMPDSYQHTPAATMESPLNRFRTPGSLSFAVAAGMTLDPQMVPREEIARLGAEAVALTHGHPMAFLTGSVLSELLNMLLYDGAQLNADLVREITSRMRSRFAGQYRQAGELSALLQSVLHTRGGGLQEQMEHLECDSADRVLAGALLAVLSCPDDPDAALIAAVNHSGRSAACGAVTGALLGASMGMEAVPEFYLECLEPRFVLEELADDVFRGCPMGRESSLFDDEWDRKYVQWGR